MAAINLLGCILFGVSAVGAYIVPDTGSILHGRQVGTQLDLAVESATDYVSLH